MWLGLGTLLLSVSGARTVVPIAAWLASVFLLRFARTQPPKLAFPALAVATYAASLIALRGVFPLSQLLPFALVGLGDLLPYALDRLTKARLRGVPRTLVFPLAATTLGFLAGTGQFGTFGAPAYTQVGNLPLSQLLSITGLWGVTFLVMWLAPVANELWERGFDLRAAAAPVLAFTVLLLAVLAYGGVQLAFFAPSAATVRIAAIAPDRALSDAYEGARIVAAPRTPAQRAAIRERHMDPIIDDLSARTAQAADAGARIVAWSEAAAFVFAEDEAALLARAGAVAAAEGVYLQVGIVSVQPRTEYPFVEIRARSSSTRRDASSGTTRRPPCHSTTATNPDQGSCRSSIPPTAASPPSSATTRTSRRWSARPVALTPTSCSFPAATGTRSESCTPAWWSPGRSRTVSRSCGPPARASRRRSTATERPSDGPTTTPRTRSP